MLPMVHTQLSLRAVPRRDGTVHPPLGPRARRVLGLRGLRRHLGGAVPRRRRPPPPVAPPRLVRGAAGVGPRLRWRRRGPERRGLASLRAARRNHPGARARAVPLSAAARYAGGVPPRGGFSCAARVGRTPARHVLHHRGPRVERRGPAAVRAPGRRRPPSTPRGDGARRRAAALRVERRGGASGGAALRAVCAARPDAGRRAPRAREHAHRAGGGRGRKDSAAAATAAAAATVAEHAADADADVDAAGGDGDGATTNNMGQTRPGTRRAPRRLPPACAAGATQTGVGRPQSRSAATRGTTPCRRTRVAVAAGHRHRGRGVRRAHHHPRSPRRLRRRRRRGGWRTRPVGPGRCQGQGGASDRGAACRPRRREGGAAASAGVPRRRHRRRRRRR